MLFFNYYISLYIFLLIPSYLIFLLLSITNLLWNIIFYSHNYILNILESIRIIFEYFLNLFKKYFSKVTLLKIRPWLVSVDLIYFNSSYSLEVKHYIQGESSFLDTYLSFVKIELILYFYITLYIEPGDPVECKYSCFHSSLQVEEYFCFTRYTSTNPAR